MRIFSRAATGPALEQTQLTDLNTLPVIEGRDGIPQYTSPYIVHRNKIGAALLDKCAAHAPADFPMDEVWKVHPDFPLAICFNVHSLCNERCVMCPYEGIDAGKPTRVMDLDKFKHAFGEFMELGGRILTFNNFSDIFAHPVGMEYVRVALRHLDAVNTYFVTNGLALKKRYVDEIVSTGWNDIIYISCHAFSEETFQRVTGVNAFGRVLESATYLAKRHPSPERIIIQYAMDSSAPAEIDRAKAYWGDLHVTLNLFMTHTWSGLSHHRPEPEHAGRLSGCKGWGYDAGQPFYQAVVQENGNLTLCCRDLQGKVVLGNVFEDGLAASWKSQRMKNILRLIYRGSSDPRTMEICRKCSLVQLVPEAPAE